MNKRQIIISSIAGVLILFIAIRLSGVLADSKTPPARKTDKGQKTVATMAVTNGRVQFRLPVYGKLAAYNRVEIYAEVNGILQPTGKQFLEGVTYARGERLLQIDNTEAMANLMAQRSSYLNAISGVLPDLKLDYPADFAAWMAYLENLDIDANVAAPPKASGKKAELYLTSRGVYSSYYNLKSAEARLAKYDIHAPFDGVVTTSNIRPGTLVRPGQLLGEYISAGTFELEASISIRFLPLVQVGNGVDLKAQDIAGHWRGSIARINKKIDEATQTVKVYISVSAPDLREGMYLQGDIKGLHVENAIALPRRLLVDNNHVYTVANDSILQKTQIEIVEYTENDALVRGLPDGTRVVYEVMPGAFTGMVVRQNLKTDAK